MHKQIAVLSVVVGVLCFGSVGFAAPPVLEVSPTSLEFSAYAGGANPEKQILSIWRGGGNGPLNWEVIEDCNWLTVNPTSGKSMGEVDDVNVIVDISGLTRGTYNCQLTVDAGTAANSPQIVNVNLTVIGPILELSATQFEFTAFEGGVNPADQILSISNTGGGTLNWVITGDCNWLTVEPTSGSSAGEVDDVNVIVDISGLTGGTYNCQLTVDAGTAANSPQIVNVNLTVIGPILELSATQFEFTAFEGGVNPADQILSISNTGGGTLNWEITGACGWLTVAPDTGSSTGEADDVNMSVDISGLVEGEYNCELTISDVNAANSPQIVDVNLIVIGPLIGLSAMHVEFTAFAGGANPNEQILSISNSGIGTLNWEITHECSWLSAEPNSGSSAGEVDDVNISVDISGLAMGIYDCNLTVSDANAANSPQIVTVTLKVVPISLNYDAESYAYAHAFTPSGIEPDTDTDQDFSSNGKVESFAEAYAWVDVSVWLEWQRSYTKDSVEVIYNANGANLISTFKGWGEWAVIVEGGGGGAGTGGGDGNGYTSLVGTIEIGVFEGYPPGSSGLILKFDAEIIGDAPSSWENWDWWLKIWDDDPNAPLVLLNDSNTTSTIEVLAGEILNVEFYHEAEGNIWDGGWPEEGLESTVMIDILILADVDINGDGYIDFVDFAILASQWLQAPGVPSADIAPPSGNGIVDIWDLELLMKYWLWEE